MDRLIRCLAYGGKVSVTLISSSELVEKARVTHDLTPTTTAALGRLLTIGELIGAGLKNDKESFTIQVKGDGPIGNCVCVVNYGLKIKGYVQNPLVELPLKENGKIDVGGAVGRNGFINVIKDMGMKEPYVGVTPIVTGEIAEDFVRFFAESEQQPSVVSLGVLVDKDGVKSSGGYLVTLMPDADEDVISRLEENLNKVPPISSMLEKNASLEEIAEIVTGDSNIFVLEGEDVPKFVCDCNRERFERGLISLGKEELKNVLKTDNKIETVCNFCGKKYVFNKDDIEKLMM
ncbi:MAG: Hsp33 family molecular chaperone HslO [Clostridia bacterium]|nr:Hsp33 family molecular chaperone HslO [Clostridia bacterium]MBR3152185.1 Hsp33 family molecular chaperone HslO [Clostridia bacterium]MBR3152278.1 Hsp33 family molecular chaperone HslO [Clostridia bacterium]